VAMADADASSVWRVFMPGELAVTVDVADGILCKVGICFEEFDVFHIIVASDWRGRNGKGC